ncbi:acyl-CoA thioesterase [Carboxylicivirga sp. N1Y90]|uniref:acyl-CoA thioesterase n=1 Tax=Carboxylicivirga fragile TaxID=3417571 RepID=UPI003D35275B|nr:acyl-CoA thioesterase [Marinilabiliaceae bacterium N1Y90]
MLKGESTIRVRYGETDQMGVVNNANYPSYYEIGRTELLREYGISYKQIEEKGCMLPLVDLYVKYHKPAFYDDVLTISTSIKEMPSSKIRFDYRIYNQEGTLINEGYTNLAFLNSGTRRPVRIPDFLKELLSPHF